MEPKIKNWLILFGIFFSLLIIFSFLYFLSIPKIPEEISAPKKPKEPLDVPKEIFNLTGKIQEIKENELLVFFEEKNQTFKVIFDEETIISSSLEKLKEGDLVAIEAMENIKGKKEFKASYINLIEL